MDRIQIINDALFATGNNRVNVEYDGSPEWQVADPSYRRAVSYLLSRHSWNFANKTETLAGLMPTSPHPVYDRAFALPSDCMVVESAWIDGRPLGEYEILDQVLCCRQTSGVVIKYVRVPEIGRCPAIFIELLTIKVEAYILRGLNEDTDNARRRDADVEALLEETRSILDRQDPPRAVFRSRTAARRRARGSRSLTVC